jgi:hypothetical protein
MKNLHLILVNKAVASLYHCSNTRDLFTTRQTSDDLLYEVYITSDEEVKEGDWCLEFNVLGYAGTVCKAPRIIPSECFDKKIILTTDQSLIKDGVQAIDDEFLEWFLNNPSCEKVEVNDLYGYPNVIHTSYKMVIPKEEPKDVVLGYKTSLDAQMLDKNGLEEPKQETLEEAAEKIYPNAGYDDEMWCDSGELFREKFIEGAKWQGQNSYSREDMINFAEFVSGYPDKNRNQLGQILHAKSRYDGAERTSDLLMIWADLGRTAKDQTV